MKSVLRALMVLLVALFCAASGWAHRRPEPKKSSKAKSAASKTAVPADNGTSAAEATLATATPAPPPPASEGTSDQTPHWIPMPAYDGGLGLFTQDSGETLPRHGASFEAGVNKFSRDPGGITVLDVGWSVGYGLFDWLTTFVQFDPHRHIHVDAFEELSLNTPSTGAFPQFDSTIYRSILPIAGARPAYPEDYPFAFADDGGVGNVDVGFKVGLLSELRGNPLSLALRNDFYIPTRTSLSDLLDNGTQSGALDYQISLDMSKYVFGKSMFFTSDLGYKFTKDPVFSGLHGLTRADQVNAGFGFIGYPKKRFQMLSEYNALIFVGAHTPDTSFDPRDPVDGIWGLRAYLTRFFALDVGYRYMLNLNNHHDRNGFVIKLASVYWPEKVVPPPNTSAQCTVDKTTVLQGSNEQVDASIHAVDSQNLPLTYTWSASGGKIVGLGPDVQWDSTGVAPGDYTITAQADDGRGGTATCTSQVTVKEKPAPPPTMACSADRSSVLAGEKVNVTAAVTDQSGTPLAYQWRTNGGEIVGTGSAIQLDTSGLAPGSYTVTGRVENGKGQAADCSVNVGVQQPPPPPQASKINQCYFGFRSARVDNVCKRILDDVAIRLQNDPKARVVIVGYATPRMGRAARLAERLAQERAENARKYLAENRGVSPSQVETRAGAGQKGAGKENRRMDIIWVPEGASY